MRLGFPKIHSVPLNLAIRRAVKCARGSTKVIPNANHNLQGIRKHQIEFRMISFTHCVLLIASRFVGVENLYLKSSDVEESKIHYKKLFKWMVAMGAHSPRGPQEHYSNKLRSEAASTLLQRTREVKNSRLHTFKNIFFVERKAKKSGHNNGNNNKNGNAKNDGKPGRQQN